mgnify:CR=1 FL=1
MLASAERLAAMQCNASPVLLPFRLDATRQLRVEWLLVCPPPHRLTRDDVSALASTRAPGRCPGDKKVSRVWRRLAGRTALEAAVTLGHAAPAAELLAAGAAVRPQAWAALTLYCPPAAHDQLAALLAASQVRLPCACKRAAALELT